MKLTRIDYDGGYVWVDNTATHAEKGNWVIEMHNPIVKSVCQITGHHLLKQGGYNDKLIIGQTNLSIPNVSYVEFEEDVETDIEKCIKVVKSLVKDNCPNHTPYWGACVDCGRRENFEVLPDPEDVIEALEDLTPSKGRYSEDDLRKMFRHGENRGKSEFKDDFLTEDEAIKYLNQPPLEIEIEMEEYTSLDVPESSYWSYWKSTPVTYMRDGKTYLKVKIINT